MNDSDQKNVSSTEGASPNSPGIQLVVGLGNPGLKHRYDRHNAGFWFAERVSEAAFALKSSLNSELSEANVRGEKLRVCKPMTFMNRSGDAVQSVLHYFKLHPETMLVAHDELDLPVGAVKLKFGGGHGGQNGLRDIIAKIGHGNFWRLRIGIGHPGCKEQVTGWVLGKPTKDDLVLLERGLDRAEYVLPDLVDGGYEHAMKHLHTGN